MLVPSVPPPRRGADAPPTAAVELPLPREEEIDPERQERRRVLLRQIRARRAMALARKSAVARTAVLLRSIGYPDQRS
jgi:hypothetical protein